jgi:hypothetical protein
VLLYVFTFELVVCGLVGATTNAADQQGLRLGTATGHMSKAPAAFALGKEGKRIELNGACRAPKHEDGGAHDIFRLGPVLIKEGHNDGAVDCRVRDVGLKPTGRAEHCEVTEQEITSNLLEEEL